MNISGTQLHQGSELITEEQKKALALSEMKKLERFIDVGDFEGARDYGETLSTTSKLAIVTEIKELRTGTKYTSKRRNVLETIAIYACMLGTANGRLFFINPTRDGNSSHIPEYEVYLQRKFDELRKYLGDTTIRKEEVELNLLQSLQIIGLSMDRLFFFVNKPESAEFVRNTKNQLHKWLGKIEELLTRNIMRVNQDLNKPIEDAINSARTLQSIITINFITYDSGVDEIKKSTVFRALEILSLDQKKIYYYQEIAEANLELALAKNAANTQRNYEKTEELKNTLISRFKYYNRNMLDNSSLFLGLNLPEDAQELSDDSLEIISALFDFKASYTTKDYCKFFNYLLGNEREWNYYSNERQQGFLLIIIEKILQIFIDRSKEIQPEEMIGMTRKLLQYIEKCSNGQLLQEDLSRIFLKIANTCGNSCLGYFDLSVSGVFKNSFGAKNNTLLIIGLTALTKGVRISHKEERVKEFAPFFLEAIFLEFITKNKFTLSGKDSQEERIEKGYGILCDSWLGRPSHIESLQNQQIEEIISRLQKINSPDNVSWFGLSIQEICDILSDTYHGYYKFEIRAYNKNNGHLGDIFVYTIPLTLGYELHIYNPLGKPEELSALGHSHEIQIICKEISRFIQTSIHIFSGPEYLSVVHRFENEVPHESQNSIAQWYRRIIEKEVTSVVFVQQKAKLIPNEADSQAPFLIEGAGVECLLRFQDPKKGLIFGPGDNPGTGKSLGNNELGVFEAMNALGAYTTFMHDHLKLIFEQMAKIDIPFSLNVRGDELTAASYITHIDILCEQFGINPERITIEILEEGLDLKNQQIILSIQHFLQKGMRISVDDFGSNQSGEVRINGIREIHAKVGRGKFEIKLDAIYTEQLLTNFEYVKGLVATLKLAGATICCERIENEVHLVQAFHAGIDTIQGYTYHKPELVDTFIARYNKS